MANCSCSKRTGEGRRKERGKSARRKEMSVAFLGWHVSPMTTITGKRHHSGTVSLTSMCRLSSAFFRSFHFMQSGSDFEELALSNAVAANFFWSTMEDYYLSMSVIVAFLIYTKISREGWCYHYRNKEESWPLNIDFHNQPLRSVSCLEDSDDQIFHRNFNWVSGY